jgi:hypothetical protein
LFRDELRDGRAVIDDAELLREAGAVCTIPAAMKGSVCAPPDAMFKDVLEDIRGRYADGVDVGFGRAFETADVVDWASCIAKKAEGAGGGGR